MSRIPDSPQELDVDMKHRAEALRGRVTQRAEQIRDQLVQLRAALEEARSTGASQRELMVEYAKKVKELQDEQAALEDELAPLDRQIEFNTHRHQLDSLVQQYNQRLNQFNASQTADNLDMLTGIGHQILELDNQLIRSLQHDPGLGPPGVAPYEVLKEHLEQQLGTLKVQRTRVIDKVKHTFSRQGG